MSEAALNHITPADAVLARLTLWLQEADARAQRALTAPAHQQREEIAAILGRLNQLLQDVFADEHSAADLLALAAYGMLAINNNQLPDLFKPQKKVALQLNPALRAHLALPIAVLHEDGGDLSVAEAALAVEAKLKTAGFRPRQGRQAGKLISDEQLMAWYYAAEGGYAADETVTDYRMAKEQMLRAHPDYTSWTRDQRLAWLADYIAKLARKAVLF